MSGGDVLLPDLDHPLYAPFWAAAADARLTMQRCDVCGYVRWPPEPLCPECLTRGGTWTDLDGHGSIWSYAVYEHAFHPSLRSAVPYVCALVELDDGPRMISRIVGVEPSEVSIGARVSVVFESAGQPLDIPCFTPDPQIETAGVALPD